MLLDWDGHINLGQTVTIVDEVVPSAQSWELALLVTEAEAPGTIVTEMFVTGVTGTRRRILTLPSTRQHERYELASVLEAGYRLEVEVTAKFQSAFDGKISVFVKQTDTAPEYVHFQEESSTFWTVTHNMHAYPSVTVVSSANQQVEGDVDYVSEDVLTIDFGAMSFTGVAFLR